MVYSGTWLVLATLAFIILLYWLGYYWAWSHGQFDDIETAKYAMLKNDEEYRDDEF